MAKGVGIKGRHLYNIQEKVCLERRKFGKRKDDVLMSRMRIGHSLLNPCLYRMGEHDTGNFDKCGHAESIDNVLILCDAYERARFQIIQALRSLGINNLSPQVLAQNNQEYFMNSLFF